LQDESSGPEYSFRDFFWDVWDNKVGITAVGALFAITSILIALAIPDKYTSNAILAPKSRDGASGGLGQLASDYGGLASLAGISLGGLGDVREVEIAIETVKSRTFFAKYMYKDFVKAIMASKSWDRSNQELILDDSLFDSIDGKWVRDEESVVPTVQETHRVFIEQVVRIREDADSGLVLMSATHHSPVVAFRIVEKVIAGIDDAIRQSDVQEAEKAIEFLEAQIEKNSLVSLDEVFAQLIEEQTKTIMLANASREYVFQTIEPPVISEEKSLPKRSLIAILGTMLGLFVGVLAVLLRRVVVFSRAPS